MSNEFENMDKIHIDVLRELGNIGAGNALTALSKMVDKKIDMNVPEAKIVEFTEVADILGDPESIVVGILISISGDIDGFIMFVLDRDSANLLIKMLLGDYHVNTDGAFSEIEISALKEAGNILVSSYVSALSMITNLKLVPSVPDIAIDMAGAIISFPAIKFGAISDSIVYIETEFSEGVDKFYGDFFLIPDGESYDLIFKALGVEQ